jgi:secreted trypsin-like serine protease
MIKTTIIILLIIIIFNLAGHCLMDMDENEPVAVILGANKYYNSEEPGRLRLTSRKYWIHENFSMPNAENDLAIIELPMTVNFTDQIRPIKICKDQNFDKHRDADAKEIIVVLSGFGFMNNSHRPAENLQTARMRLIPYDECLKFQSHYVEKLTRKHVCAIGRNNRPGFAVSPCDGDSGSALVLADSQELIGITSYVKDAENGSALHYNDCRAEEAPAVFVRIPSYLKWISEKTGIKF